MSDAPFIALEGIGRVFDAGEDGVPVEALKDVSLDIREGEFVCVTGPSGSGKSTLMHILGCLDQPSGGRYRLAGREVQKLGPDALAWLRRRLFGFVFQSHNLLESATALDNVELPGRYAGMESESRKARARQLLAGLSLADRADRLPSELSGGEQQRVAIARALMGGGRVLLADEPTGSLDLENGEAVLCALEELVARGHAVVIVSHDPDIASRARRRIELRDGRMVADTSAGPRSAERLGDAPPALVGHSGPVRSTLDALGVGLSVLVADLRRWRVLLPMLGVLVSVWLGALAFGIGDGAYTRAMNQVNVTGLDTIDVMARFEYGQDYGDFRGLTLVDAEHIERIPNVRAVSPEKFQDGVIARYGDVAVELRVIAWVDQGTREGRGHSGYRMNTGDFITVREDENLEQVAVLGSVAREKLFPPEVDPIGEQILLGTVPFRVKGILTRQIELGHGADPEISRQIEEFANSHVHVPYRTASALLFGDDNLHGVHAYVDNVDHIADTAASIRDLGIRLHGKDVFGVTYPEEYLAYARAHRNQLLATVLLIAGVALLAANLSVMAIMLMAVRARRREIGVRVALGARRRDILRQFLSEALILSVAGGAMGALVALACIPALGLFEVPTSFAWWHFALPMACALAVAIPFAVFPAHRASRLDPATALAEI